MSVLETAAAATYILLVTYGNQTEEIAATSKTTCQEASDALKNGSWTPLGREGQKLEKVECIPGNRFAPGYDKIRGYNG